MRVEGVCLKGFPFPLFCFQKAGLPFREWKSLYSLNELNGERGSCGKGVTYPLKVTWSSWLPDTKHFCVVCMLRGWEKDLESSSGAR